MYTASNFEQVANLPYVWADSPPTLLAHLALAVECNDRDVGMAVL